MTIPKKHFPLCWAILNRRAGMFTKEIRWQVAEIKESLEQLMKLDYVTAIRAIGVYEAFLMFEFNKGLTPSYRKICKSLVTEKEHSIYAQKNDVLNRFNNESDEV